MSAVDVSDLELQWKETWERIQAEAERRLIGREVQWDMWLRPTRYAQRERTKVRGVIRMVSTWSGKVTVYVERFRKDGNGFYAEAEVRYHDLSTFEFTGGIWFDEDGLDG